MLLLSLLLISIAPKGAYAVFDGTDAETEALMQEAEASIQAHRQGPLHITLINEAGHPVSARTHVKLLEHDFDFGANLIGFSRMREDDPAREPALEAINSLFNTVIVCDYWWNTQRKKGGELNWIEPDTGYTIADELDKRTRYHSLLYGFPKWLDTIKTEEDMWEVIDTRMKQVADRYGHRIRELDVYNEFINFKYWDHLPQAQQLKKTKYPDMSDPKNGARVLEMTRKHFPDAKLVVLEAGIWNVPNPIFQEIFEYFEDLIALDAPFDYIGFQGHYYARGGVPFEKGTRQYGPRTFMMDEINRGLEQVATLGKRMVVTEFNAPSRSNQIKDPDQPSLTDEEIAAWEKNFYTLIFSKPYIDGLSRWFTIDNLGGRGMDAGVVTEEGELKPNYFALKELIKEKWHTELTGNPPQGQARFEGFYGKYLVQVDGYEDAEVELNGEDPKQVVTLVRK